MKHLPECFIDLNPLVTECRVCDALCASQHRGFMLGWGEGHHVGYGHGLDAAEAAVAAVPWYRAMGYTTKDEFIAVIRALKEKP